MVEVTRQFAEYASKLRYEDLPAEVVEKVKHFILDLAGIALRASCDADSTPSIRNTFLSMAAPGEVTVIGLNETVHPAHAALINGSFAHSLDFDDTHREGSLHPGASVIPAVLAVAENEGISGKRVITAITVGYDVTCKLSMALDPKAHYDKGFHPTATAGNFGATAALGNLLGWSADDIANALGVCISTAAGSLQYLENGAWNKRIHPGLAAYNAIMAIELVRNGFVAAALPIEGRFGLFQGYTDNARPELAVQDLGKRFEILYTAIKPYPACRYTHGPLDAIIDLAVKNDLKPEDVERVEIGLSSAGYELVGAPLEAKQNPKSVVDGQFSMPFLTAVALTRRRMAWDDYELLADPSVLELTKRVNVVRSEEADSVYPEKWLASVTIEANGKTYTDQRWETRGEPELPLTWEEVVGKFETLASALLSNERMKAVVDTVATLEELDSVAKLNRQLRLDPPSSAE